MLGLIKNIERYPYKYFEEQQILMINADCLEVMQDIDEKSIDLVLTDPPYGINADQGIGRSIINNTNIIKKDNWDNTIPSKEIFNEIFRISKNQIIWGGNYFIKYLENTRCMLYWLKPNTCDRNFADGEIAWTNLDMNSRCFRKSSLDLERFHPTQKPVALFKWCLDLCSKENDLILDCFSGSGTTAIACYNLKRKCICIERDFTYWEKSCKRFEEHIKQLRFDF